jgi:serine/threonine protein kinase/formylglycine-generating enzyme required for sulfatase activity
MTDRYRQLDDLFFERAEQRGYLLRMHIDVLRHDLAERRQTQPETMAHELAVETGLLTSEAALNILDAREGESREYMLARLFGIAEVTDRAPRDQQGRSGDTHRDDQDFSPVMSLDPEADADLTGQADDDLPVAPVEYINSSGDSHLEMELPPPASRSGESLFEDQGFELLHTDREVTLDDEEDASIDAVALEAIETDDSESGILTANDVAESTEDPLEPEPREESSKETIEKARQETQQETRQVTAQEGTARDEDNRTDTEPVPHPAAHFRYLGSKGAQDDFSSFGDDDAPVEDESEEISVNMSDSAVNEVLDQADDSYFGTPADLTSLPMELLAQSGLLAGPIEEVIENVDHYEEMISTAPPPPPVPVHDFPEELTGVDFLIATDEADTDSFQPAHAGEVIELDETDQEADLPPVEESSVDLGRLREPSRGRFDQVIAGDTLLGDEDTGLEGLRDFTGQEMSLSELRARMGLGQGVKLGTKAGDTNRLPAEGPRRRYTLRRQIARGGMGKIIEVEDNDLRRRVALKILRKDMLERLDLVERFLEEAQITGQLEHPNIVPVHEIGVDGRGNLYFTMKLVEGEELSQVIRRLRRKDRVAEREYPLSRLIDIYLKVCEGVAFAHSNGVIHRDLKPANIMVGRYGEVQIMDWGVAKIIGRNEKTTGRLVASDRKDDDSARTMAGSLLGTPSYMSPEQARGDVAKMGPASDIFSLGTMLYQLLCLSTPWPGKTSDLVIEQVKELEPELPSLRAPERRIPPELEQLAMKCLHKDPDKRLESVKDLVGNLRSWQEGRTMAAVHYSIGQLIGKWMIRHKAVVLTSFLVLAALIAGVIGASRHLQQQELERANSLIAAAQTRLESASAAFEDGDLVRAQKLAEEARDDYRAAAVINPLSDPAGDGQSEAILLLTRVRTTQDEAERARADELAKKEHKQRVEQALMVARGLMTAAESMVHDDATMSDEIDDAFAQARTAWQHVRDLDQGSAEASAGIAEINLWQRELEGRRQAEQNQRRLNELVEAAEQSLNAALQIEFESFEQAQEILGDTLDDCDEALHVTVSGREAERSRERAFRIKARAALELANLAIEHQAYDLVVWFLRTAENTGQMSEEIAKARAVLELRLEEQSRFRRLMADADSAIERQDWVVAMTAIDAALAEARTSRYAASGDEARLERMRQIARLEDVRKRDRDAVSSGQLEAVLGDYETVLEEELSDDDLKQHARFSRDSARSRLGQMLVTEANEVQDDRMRLELLERALVHITDRARAAEVRARLDDVRLRIATSQASDRLVLLPRGTFVVGSNRESDRNPRDNLVHEDFVFIQRNLVTNLEFRQFVEEGGYAKPEFWHEEALPHLAKFVDSTGKPGPSAWVDGGFDSSLAHHPVTGVSWYEAAAFAKWAGRRLPTPEEWEIAAGAPAAGDFVSQNQPEFPFGPRENVPEEGVQEPRPVGTAEWDHNRHGVRDMGSNVAEWTSRVTGNHARAVVKGAEPGLRRELFLRFARRTKNSSAQLLERSPGRGFRCMEELSLNLGGD